MTRKIFRSILTVGVAVLACSLLLVMGCFYSFYEGMQEHQLGDELRIAAATVETNGSTYLEKIKSDRFRVTWIASDGTVLSEGTSACTVTIMPVFKTPRDSPASLAWP